MKIRYIDYILILLLEKKCKQIYPIWININLDTDFFIYNSRDAYINLSLIEVKSNWSKELQMFSIFFIVLQASEMQFNWI